MKKTFQVLLLVVGLGPILVATTIGVYSQAVTSSSSVNVGATKVTVTTPPNDVVAGPTNLTGTGTVSVSAQGSGSVGIIATGSGAGLTFGFQGSVDGTNYVTIPCVVPSTGAIVTTASANGTWTCQAAGYQNVRVNLTAISSGTETFTLNASAGSNQPPIGTQGTSTNITGIGNSSISTFDPCVYQAKTNVAISTASGTTALVTGVSAKKIYVCSLFVLAPTAVSVSLSEGSGATCGTSAQAGVIGVATNGTAANGAALAANGGFTLGNGMGTIASTATNANYLCLFQSGTAQIAGNLTYVQQ